MKQTVVDQTKPDLGLFTQPRHQDESRWSAIHVEALVHTYPAVSKPKQACYRKPRHDRQAALSSSGGCSRQALAGVSFDVWPGEIFGILGPNGGGKTTLFRIVATLLGPTGGRVSVLGCDVCAQPHQVRQRLGVVFQWPSLDGKLSARENLRHQGHLYGLRGVQLTQQIDRLMARFKLGDKTDWPVEFFSGGMKRRVELAKALLHEPAILLLDEPSTGLDVGARRDLWEILSQLRHWQGMTVVLTTHLMDEADQCDRLAILDQGKLVAIDTPAHLKAQIGGDVITLQPMVDQEAGPLAGQITDRFGPWKSGSAPLVLDGKIHLQQPDGPAFLATLAGAFPGRIRSMRMGQPTLEDVFLHRTGRVL